MDSSEKIIKSFKELYNFYRKLQICKNESEKRCVISSMTKINREYQSALNDLLIESANIDSLLQESTAKILYIPFDMILIIESNFKDLLLQIFRYNTHYNILSNDLLQELVNCYTFENFGSFQIYNINVKNEIEIISNFRLDFWLDMKANKGSKIVFIRTFSNFIALF